MKTNRTKVVAVANNKGGVGKTTTVVALGFAWAKKGYKVLFVDLDSQANLTMITSQVPVENIEITVKESLIYKVAPPIVKVAENVELIPSGLALSNFENELGGVQCREFLLTDMLKTLEGQYDVVIIDCPPALGLLTYNALVAADALVMTATSDALSYAGMIMIGNLAKGVRSNSRLNPNLKAAGVVITKYKPNKIQGAFLEKIRSEIGDVLVEPPIREATRVQQATAAHRSIFDYDPDGNATMDYLAAADELEKRILL